MGAWRCAEKRTFLWVGLVGATAAMVALSTCNVTRV